MSSVNIDNDSGLRFVEVDNSDGDLDGDIEYSESPSEEEGEEDNYEYDIESDDDGCTLCKSRIQNRKVLIYYSERIS